MKIGLQIPSFTWPGDPDALGMRLAEIGRTADEAGFASLWVMDHHFQIAGVGSAEEPMLEAYSALSYLAGVTKHARLGAMVTGVIYRYPGILVKTVSTLDVLSGGRAYLGIGAGWACRSRRSSNASSSWRRRCRSPDRCGREQSRRTPVNTTSWPRPSTTHSR